MYRRRKRRILWPRVILILAILGLIGYGGYRLLFGGSKVAPKTASAPVSTTQPAAAPQKQQPNEKQSNAAKPLALNTKATKDKSTKPEVSKGSISEEAQKGKEYYVVIDKPNFTLTVYDSQDKVAASFPVAIGDRPGQKRREGDMTTPEGEFVVDEDKVDASYWTHDFHDGKGVIEGAYGPYFISLETYSVIGGKKVFWDGIGIHGTHDDASIGNRVSEGCIRLHNGDLRKLCEYVKKGTKVEIRGGAADREADEANKEEAKVNAVVDVTIPSVASSKAITDVRANETARAIPTSNVQQEQRKQTDKNNKNLQPDKNKQQEKK